MIDLYNLAEQIEMLPITSEEVTLETMKDPVMSKVLNCVKVGWSYRENELKSYFSKKLNYQLMTIV